MGVTLYQYPKCSTCRRAVKWLEAHGISFESMDIVGRPPSVSTLRRIAELSRLPPNKMLNTSGQSYREGRFKERLPGMNQDEIFTAMAADGKLIKRPMVLGETFALVGFDEAAYSSILSGRS